MVQSSVPWFGLGDLTCIELWWKRLHYGSIKRPMVWSRSLFSDMIGACGRLKHNLHDLKSVQGRQIGP